MANACSPSQILILAGARSPRLAVRRRSPLPLSENSNGHGGASSASSSERAAPRSRPTPAKGKGRMKKKAESEEDVELKELLEQCLWCGRAQDPNPGVQNIALENMRQEIRTATSPTNFVPNSVKFLHDRTSSKAYIETMSWCDYFDTKSSMADILSVLALMSPEGERESLKYLPMGSKDDTDLWDHEHKRNLADEIGEDDQALVVACLQDSQKVNEKMKNYCDVNLTSLPYSGTGDVLQGRELLYICSQHPEAGQTHLVPAVHIISLIAIAEELGPQMVVRSLEHFIQYHEQNIRRAVPLALGVLLMSNPTHHRKHGYLLGCSKGVNKWLLDSGASYHITGQKSCLKNLRPAVLDPEIGYPLTNALHQDVFLDEMGDVDMENIRVSNVMCSSSFGETDNLISVGRLTDVGFRVTINNGQFEITTNSPYKHVVGHGHLDYKLMCYPVTFFNEMASLQPGEEVDVGTDASYDCCEGVWMLDSDCPFHITKEDSWLTDQTDLSASQPRACGVVGSNDEIRCTVKGTMTGEKILIKNVYYSHSAQSNLVSVAQLDMEGYGMVYMKDHCKIYWMRDQSLVGRAVKDACRAYYVEYFYARN